MRWLAREARGHNRWETRPRRPVHQARFYGRCSRGAGSLRSLLFWVEKGDERVATIVTSEELAMASAALSSSSSPGSPSKCGLVDELVPAMDARGHDAEAVMGRVSRSTYMRGYLREGGPDVVALAPLAHSADNRRPHFYGWGCRVPYRGAGPFTARRPPRLLRIRPDTRVRGHLGAGPDLLELRGLPLLEFHGCYLLSLEYICLVPCRAVGRVSLATPHRTGDVPPSYRVA